MKEITMLTGLTSPKTVAQAIAPFKKITGNLKTVLAAQKAASAASQKRIDAARATAKTVESTEGAAIKLAQEESLRATALIDNLEKLFSGDVIVQLDAMTPSEKANAGRKLES
jgi:hypothetical protein